MGVIMTFENPSPKKLKKEFPHFYVLFEREFNIFIKFLIDIDVSNFMLFKLKETLFGFFCDRMLSEIYSMENVTLLTDVELFEEISPNSKKSNEYKYLYSKLKQVVSTYIFFLPRIMAMHSNEKPKEFEHFSKESIYQYCYLYDNKTDVKILIALAYQIYSANQLEENPNSKKSRITQEKALIAAQKAGKYLDQNYFDDSLHYLVKEFGKHQNRVLNLPLFFRKK